MESWLTTDSRVTINDDEEPTLLPLAVIVKTLKLWAEDPKGGIVIAEKMGTADVITLKVTASSIL